MNSASSFFDDTICAVATPGGTGGIAVIRVSGPEAIAIVNGIWKGKSLGEAASHTAHLGELIDPSTNDILDQAVATLFRNPRSFTGEDVVELSVHGSVWIQSELVRLLVCQGCRIASPGEFTRRAFSNGRIDLAEAEAVADVIAASSKAAHALAISQLRGEFSQQIARLRDSLIDLASLLELELDFSEEEVEFASREKLTALANETLHLVTRLAASFATGNAIRKGIPVAIVGPTNAGKSSLLNQLIGDNRAIVSDIHGTTRDTIEEVIDISGYSFRIIDTAGLRDTADPIETIGIDRSHQSASKAKVVLFLYDSSGPLPSETIEQIRKLLSPGATLIIVPNKTDLSPAVIPHADNTTVPISALTGNGLEQLRQAIVDASGVATAMTQSEIIVTNARHYEALTAAQASLERVIGGLAANLSGDLVALDLREAIHHLGLITGSITTSDLLRTIFSRFCIGK